MTSPCTLCTSGADCATCLPRLAWEGAHLPPEPAACTTCSKADWLVLAGEELEQVAARLTNIRREPFSVDSLTHHLRKHHRTDLIRRTA